MTKPLYVEELINQVIGPDHILVFDVLIDLRLLHTRVTSSKYFEKRKFFNLDEACIFFISFDAINIYTYFTEVLSRLNYL